MVIHENWNAAECMLYKVRELKYQVADHWNLNRYAVYMVGMNLKQDSVVIELAIPSLVASFGELIIGCSNSGSGSAGNFGNRPDATSNRIWAILSLILFLKEMCRLCDCVRLDKPLFTVDLKNYQLPLGIDECVTTCHAL